METGKDSRRRGKIERIRAPLYFGRKREARIHTEIRSPGLQNRERGERREGGRGKSEWLVY